MKKLLGYIFLSFAVLFISSTVLSCIINDVEKEDLPVASLTVAQSGDAFNIAFPPITNMKYANIIRQSCASDQFDSSITTVNIGQVIPKDVNDLPTSFIFEDPYTVSGNYYRYYIRYFNGSIYTKTQPTVCKEGNGSGLAELTVTSPELTFEWNEQTEDYILTLDTDVTVPADFTELAVLFNNGENTRPFTIGTPTSNIVPATTSYIDLQKRLSLEFLDVQITQAGLIGIRLNDEENENYTRYWWTISKDATMHVNYTDAAGNPLAKSDNCAIFVPSTQNPENGFDFSTSRLPLFIQ
ncbi:MAG: hypothetical protein K6B73_02050 [Treponema sp.]|nr:hypothetical protein [Treponema sp.]